MKFRSKISYGIMLPLALIFTAVLLLMIVNKIWFMAVFILIIGLLITYCFVNTYYLIDGNSLVVRSGFLFNKTIPIQSIFEIRDTKSILSAPALSLDRIEVKYNKRDSVVISPKDKLHFIDELQKRNASIVFKIH
jgi:hypothetical protein